MYKNREILMENKQGFRTVVSNVSPSSDCETKKRIFYRRRVDVFKPAYDLIAVE